MATPLDDLIRQAQAALAGPQPLTLAEQNAARRAGVIPPEVQARIDKLNASGNFGAGSAARPATTAPAPASAAAVPGSPASLGRAARAAGAAKRGFGAIGRVLGPAALGALAYQGAQALASGVKMLSGVKDRPDFIPQDVHNAIVAGRDVGEDYVPSQTLVPGFGALDTRLGPDSTNTTRAGFRAEDLMLDRGAAPATVSQGPAVPAEPRRPAVDAEAILRGDVIPEAGTGAVRNNATGRVTAIDARQRAGFGAGAEAPRAPALESIAAIYGGDVADFIAQQANRKFELARDAKAVELAKAMITGAPKPEIKTVTNPDLSQGLVQVDPRTGVARQLQIAPPLTEENIAHTMKTRGMTRDQVLQLYNRTYGQQ